MSSEKLPVYSLRACLELLGNPEIFPLPSEVLTPLQFVELGDFFKIYFHPQEDQMAFSNAVVGFAIRGLDMNKGAGKSSATKSGWVFIPIKPGEHTFGCEEFLIVCSIIIAEPSSRSPFRVSKSERMSLVKISLTRVLT